MKTVKEALAICQSFLDRVGGFVCLFIASVAVVVVVIIVDEWICRVMDSILSDKHLQTRQLQKILCIFCFLCIKVPISRKNYHLSGLHHECIQLL